MRFWMACLLHLLRITYARYRCHVAKSFQAGICPRAHGRTDQLIPFAEGKYSQDSAYSEHRGISFISRHRSPIHREVFENTGCMQCPISVYIYIYIYWCGFIVTCLRARVCSISTASSSIRGFTLDKKIDTSSCSLGDKRCFIILDKR